MSIFSGLNTAATLDRLSRTVRLDSDPRIPSLDPFFSRRMNIQIDWMLAESVAELRAQQQARQRREAVRLEREMPGYTEELKRQRAVLGLPTR